MKLDISTQERLVGAIEAGGTKFVCAVGSGPGVGMRGRVEFPTRDDPAMVLAEVTSWFEEQQKSLGKLEGLGIASFGPVDLDRASSTYGFITSTPKTGWRNTDILGAMRRVFPGVPMGFDTDVNGAALGEFVWGHARGLDDFVYITIGTGIGAGAMVGGQLVHGLVHPEMGHMRLPRLSGDDFAGVCRYHGACWEGLCSGPAILARTGIAAERLSADHPAWRFETEYVALALSSIVCVLSPRRIILGGSVRKGGTAGQDRFFRDVRRGVREALGGYVVSPAISTEIDAYIVAPQLEDDAGVCGAMALGLRALERGA
ncbi:MAG TPA: ROK family protein [Polyangium sp.]|nr:ROK family protein [Polyangium sp.]